MSQKILNVPFFVNNGDGNQCMQVAIQSVVKYFLNQDLTLEQLDEMTGRKPGLWTWTTQGVMAMDYLGLKVKYFSKEPLEPFLGEEDYIKEHFGKDADKILQFTDLPVVVESVRKLLGKNLFAKKVFKLEELEDCIMKGYVPIVALDWNKIYGTENAYQGHFVVMTGFDDENIYFHHSGPGNPEENMKVSKEKFMSAWNTNGTDNDLVVVYGTK